MCALRHYATNTKRTRELSPPRLMPPRAACCTVISACTRSSGALGVITAGRASYLSYTAWTQESFGLCSGARPRPDPRAGSRPGLVALRYRQFNTCESTPQALVCFGKHNTACDSRETAKETRASTEPSLGFNFRFAPPPPLSPRSKSLNTVRSLSAPKNLPFKTSQIRMGYSW